MRISFLLVSVAVAYSSSAAELRDVFYQGDLVPSNIIPTFDKGYVFVYNGAKVDVYTSDGSPLSSISVDIPKSLGCYIDNAAADVDGTIAAAVDFCKMKVGGGIAIFDRTGKQTKFFYTGVYSPTQLCFGPDHSIWTLGWTGPKPDAGKADYNILRNYSQDGQEIGAFLPRSSFEAEPNPVGPMTGLWQLRIAGGKIGALFYGSSVLGTYENPRLPRWIETDLKGKVLGRWDVGYEWNPSAFTASGALYGANHDGVSIFDPTTSAWRHVMGKPDGTLLGADENTLIFQMRGTSVLRRVAAPQ